MQYSKIISVTGMGGLFELMGSKNDGAIVRSLEDKSTKFVSSRIHSFSHLESIEVYTIRENVNLVDVFAAMGQSAVELPNDKDQAAVKSYFEKVYPDMDFERVYPSDMKKMVKWFSVLKKNDVEIKLRDEEPVEEEETAVEEEVKTEEPKKAAKAKKEAVTEVAEEEAAKPAKKKAKAAEPKAEGDDTVVAEAAPKKKAASKKKKTEE